MNFNPTDRLSVSLVTPNYNCETFLRDTFESVFSQDCDNLEYIFVDGASTDRSMDIAQDYVAQISCIICEPDNGHADALNKGFSKSSGDIMGWINSDDVLLPGCLATVRRVFETFPQVEWITGRASTINERGELTDVRPARPWSRRRFLSGDHLWIQQESTFWRRSLWEKSGASLNTDFDVANDFELWARFFRHAELYSVDRMLGCFRVREGQRSVSHLKQYFYEVDQILDRERTLLDKSFARTDTQSLTTSPTQAPKEYKYSISEDDAAIITTLNLKSGRLHSSFNEKKFAHHSETTLPSFASNEKAWFRSIQRNWRFLAATSLAGLFVVIAATLIPEYRFIIVLFALVFACLGLTSVVAIKTRRIVLHLESAIERALSERARAELRYQLLESQIEDIKK